MIPSSPTKRSGRFHVLLAGDTSVTWLLDTSLDTSGADLSSITEVETVRGGGGHVTPGDKLWSCSDLTLVTLSVSTPQYTLHPRSSAYSAILVSSSEIYN